jgi:hypothetical protein
MDMSREVLAVGHHCKLERCGCGVYHLSVGPTTLRLAPEVIDDLAAALAALRPPPVVGDGFALLATIRRGDA